MAGTEFRASFKGRIAILKLGSLVGMAWEARAVPKRTGIFELSIYGRAEDGLVGGGFQSLAYAAKQMAVPGFTRSPPYPAPDPGGDPNALSAIFAEFDVLLRDIIAAVADSVMDKPPYAPRSGR